MENNDNQKRSGWCCGGSCNVSFWGWLFIIFGGYLIASDLGLVPGSISFWSVLLVGFGVYLLLRRGRHN